MSRLNNVVMVIDDDTASRKTIYDALKNQKIGIVSVANGQEAMSKVPSEKPAVIIVNMYSEEVKGADFVRSLRIYGMGQLIHVLGVVKNMDTDAKAAQMAGVNKAISADLDGDQLSKIVNEQLSKKN